MGLFGSSKPKPSASGKSLRPVVVQPADLAEFSVRLEAIERAIGTTDATVRASIRALSESVGGVDPWRLLQLGLDPEETKRPWRWFAQACELANAEGDFSLAPRVFNFMFWWQGMQPHMTIDDYGDMWMDPIPPDAAQAISRAAADAIRQLPDDHQVAPAAGEVLTIGQIRGAVEAASSS
jgi:hypothetical protein